MTIDLRCSCGEFRGVVEDFSISGSGRSVCYCDDCQAYAHALGKAATVLDAWGGSDITPVMPSKFKIKQGRFGLMRLSKDGLYRWYTACCSSPIANSPNATLPYLGLLTTITDLTPAERDERLGRIHFRMQCQDAIGTPPPPRSEKIGVGAIVWMIGFLSKAFFKGGAKPTPFLTPDGQPVVPARVLSPQEREALRQFCGPTPTAK